MLLEIEEVEIKPTSFLLLLLFLSNYILPFENAVFHFLLFEEQCRDGDDLVRKVGGVEVAEQVFDFDDLDDLMVVVGEDAHQRVFLHGGNYLLISEA